VVERASRLLDGVLAEETTQRGSWGRCRSSPT
jgi:hypothetical protein